MKSEPAWNLQWSMSKAACSRYKGTEMNPFEQNESRMQDQPDAYEELKEPPRPDRLHESDYLFIAAEEDFDRAIPLILAALKNRKSADCRESALWLLECYADPRLTPPILHALKREVRCRVKSETYLYVNCLLSFGEPLLPPLLAIWSDRDSDVYSRAVAREYLTRFLTQPLT